MRICIDAGHGGTDSGAAGCNPFPLLEKDVNLAVSRFLEEEMVDLGHHILMTRREDRTLSLSARSDFGNRYEADLFVSIHSNSATDPAAEGMEVFHYEGSTEGFAAAKAVLDEMIASFPDHRRRGEKTANFHVLRETNMAAILVELEFITHPRQLQFLADEASQRELAAAIGRGVHLVATTGGSFAEFSPECGGMKILESGTVPEIDCTPRPITIDRLGGGAPIALPSSGEIWGESHYVTSEDDFPGGRAWPQNQTERINQHLHHSLAIYQQYDPNATIDSLYGQLPQYQKVWTPSEGGEIGQGSIGDGQLQLLTPEMELWLFTMFWTSGSKPDPGTKFLLSHGNKSVVAVGGFETGPGDTSKLGGTTWEVHAWLGTGNDSEIQVSLLENQMVPIGPVQCV